MMTMDDGDLSEVDYFARYHRVQHWPETEAPFESICPECGQPIAMGDAIVMRSSEVWVHDECAV